MLKIVHLDLKIFRKLNTLKKQIRKRLLLLRFLRKIIFVMYEKQSFILIKNKKKIDSQISITLLIQFTRFDFENIVN